MSQLNPLTPFRAVQVSTTGKKGGEDMEKREREKGNTGTQTLHCLPMSLFLSVQAVDGHRWCPELKPGNRRVL